jgi:NAD(P)-dependent dehydrogenase (short-subunit alcohol dehydrogenase family)
VRLASEGADIIAVDICAPIETATVPMASPEDLEETVRLVQAQGARAVAAQVDVRDRLGLQDAVATAVQELGRLDVVVANAGVLITGADVPVRSFLDTVQVNFVGVVNAFEAGLQHLGEGGSLIAIGSTASMFLEAPRGAGGAGYAWAKRAVAQLVHDMALQCGPAGIRVNAVHPTNVPTMMILNEPLYREFRPDVENPTLEDVMPVMESLNVMPASWIEASDVSNAVLFLASDEARYITGLQLKVDAGALTRQAYPGMGTAHG